MQQCGANARERIPTGTSFNHSSVARGTNTTMICSSLALYLFLRTIINTTSTKTNTNTNANTNTNTNTNTMNKTNTNTSSNTTMIYALLSLSASLSHHQHKIAQKLILDWQITFVTATQIYNETEINSFFYSCASRITEITFCVIVILPP